MIKITNLNKYYNKNKRNENHVINDISVDFPETGLCVFFGPSGCGKTSLLNVIGCLDTFDSGSIEFSDVVFKKYVPNTFDELRNHLIGYIFQNYNLIDSMTVYQNVEMPLDLLGVTDKDEKKRRVEYALQAVGLLKFRRRNVLALSGGQRQRVAIARALVKDPKVIIADEPTGNLDSNNTFEVMNIIKKISKERLVILVTHEKDLVDYYADIIYELQDGRIISEKVNNQKGNLNHTDVRNIYLKDYEEKDVESPNLNAKIYQKENEGKPLNLDIIFKDGIVYIRDNSNAKINFIDSQSEVKLIDAKEEDFKKEEALSSQTFNLDEMGPMTKDEKKAKGYMSLFSSIKQAFSGRRFVKRTKFSYIALIFASILFAFQFAAVAQVFNFDKYSYTKTSEYTVAVKYKKKDQDQGYTFTSIIEDAKKQDGFISAKYSNTTMKLNFAFGKYYQTESSYYGMQSTFEVYYVPKTLYPYNIVQGSDLTNDNEVVISTWNAKEILDDNLAKAAGLFEEKDLIGKECTIYIGYSNSISATVVGICDENSPVTIVSDNCYNTSIGNVETPTGYSSGYSVYIECKDKTKMIEALSSKYASVYDPIKNARSEYISERLNDKKTTIIAMAIVGLALFIYIALLVRSNMFKRIKDIGVLRSVGARRKDIISIYAGEMVAFTTVTSLIGFVSVSLAIAFSASQFSLESLGYKMFNVNIWTILLGTLIIYCVNVLAGIIPVAILMHKTPVEIIKKYDI